MQRRCRKCTHLYVNRSVERLVEPTVFLVVSVQLCLTNVSIIDRVSVCACVSVSKCVLWSCGDVIQQSLQSDFWYRDYSEMRIGTCVSSLNASESLSIKKGLIYMYKTGEKPIARSDLNEWSFGNDMDTSRTQPMTQRIRNDRWARQIVCLAIGKTLNDTTHTVYVGWVSFGVRSPGGVHHEMESHWKIRE